MTFACKHFDHDKGECCRLKTECIPGRPGCVLEGNLVLSEELQARIEAAEAERLKGRQK